MKKNILVTGAAGQLGRAIYDCLQDNKENIEDNYYFVDIKNDEFGINRQIYILDCLQEDKLKDFITRHSIDCIVNCAAYTNVSEAENHKERLREGNIVYDLNVKLPEILANICEENNISLLHISTDYVYGIDDYKFNTPIEEYEIDKIFINNESYFKHPKHNSVYGKTKWMGECVIRKTCRELALILRTSWLYYTGSVSFPAKISQKLNDDNYRYVEVVDDQIGTPTSAYSLARAIITIIQTTNANFELSSTYGIYNFSDLGTASWYDFAKYVEKIMYGKNSEYIEKVVPIHSRFDIIRPKYSVMAKDSFISRFYYVKMEHWQEAFDNFINKTHSKINFK
jgi:dTDP-4-dehydrorhamnose reductase